MKLRFSIAWFLFVGLAAIPIAVAQQPPDSAPAKQQSQPQNQQQNNAPKQPSPGSNGNEFPGDTTNVPVMPNANSSAAPEAEPGDSISRMPAPTRDADPARSPDDPDEANPSASSSESSSSFSDMDKIMARDDEAAKKRDKNGDTPEFHETAANDIDVGKYYIERKDWKAALSRFQSAMVLDPENPDAFWGMAEATHHMGDFATARMYYQRVVDYDPDSKHGKEAKKALKDPEIANAQSAAAGQPKK